MSGPDDRLSRAATLVLEAGERLRELLDDCDAFGGSCCSGLVVRSEDERLAADLSELGFTLETFQRALRERVGGKAAWRICASISIDDLIEREEP